MEFFFTPTATRDGQKVRKRILIETQKAIDKYNQLEEQAKTTGQDKVSIFSGEYDGPAFETTPLYHTDIKVEDDESEDSDSYYSRHSVFYHNTFLNKCCQKIISSSRGLKLSWTQIMCFNFFLQVPLFSIVHHVSIVQRWGGMMVLLIYTVIGFAICVPVHMMYMFMGLFTKRSYIRYWNCVPIFKGVGFSLGVISMYQEIYNVIFAGIAAQYIILLFNNKLPWYNCEFQEASNSCVPLETKHRDSFTERCCILKENNSCNYSEEIKHTFKYAAFEYYNRHILNINEEGKAISEDTNWTLITIFAVTWFFICVLSVLGLNRIRKMMTVINLSIVAIMVPIVAVVFVISPRYSMIYEFSTDFGASLTNYKFWLYTGLNIIHRELPADVIGYGAISSIGVSVTVDTAIVYILKFFFTAVFTVWMSIGVKYQLTYYNIMHSECIMTDGDVLFFAVFPDIISHMPIPQIWLIIYYIVIVFWGISTAVYVYIAFVEALMEEFHTFEKFRLLICMVLCTGAAFATIYLISPQMMEHMKSEALEIIPQMKVFMLFISFIGLYFYSITTFRHDYHFFSGEILGNYWIVGLKVSMLLVSISTTLNWFNLLEHKISNYPLILVLVPVILGIILTYTRYALKIGKTLISPSSRWGPPNRKQKLARIKFDPSHDLHYRSVVQKCPHNCLLYSSALRKEMKYWYNRKNVVEGKGTESHTFILGSNPKFISKS